VRFGAAGLLRLPLRIPHDVAGPNTLKLDTRLRPADAPLFCLPAPAWSCRRTDVAGPVGCALV
jgi:hypothetical protein